jgi:DNA-binding Lrp family transcriptional regulator
MVTALVLINVQHGYINEVANQLVDMQGVAEVYSVGGRFDLVAIIRVKSTDEMADLVTGHMLKIPYVEKSETLIAFRAYSHHDLERMFAIGAE